MIRIQDIIPALIRRVTRADSVDHIMGRFSKATRQLEALSAAEEAKANRLRDTSMKLAAEANIATISSAHAQHKADRLKDIFG
jgi:hypothetical protein